MSDFSKQNFLEVGGVWAHPAYENIIYNIVYIYKYIIIKKGFSEKKASKIALKSIFFYLGNRGYPN